MLLLCVCLPVRAAQAHESRPALLQIEQTGPHRYAVLWKQPTMGEMAVHLVPHLSNGWLELPPSEEYLENGFLMRAWRIDAPQPDPLAGAWIRIEGLDNTITDTFVRIRLDERRRLDAVLTPQRSDLQLRFGPHGPQSALTYLHLGIIHILTGPDHLLFVLALLLIVSGRRMLIQTVSAFTVAHSITLAVSTVLDIAPPVALLNTLIASSILFLGPEIVRARRGGSSFTLRHPWLIAFGFGLLHGFGFAGGLRALGLPQTEIPVALLMFNIGVEIGQLAFVALLLALRRAFRQMDLRWPRPFAALPTYAVGTLGAYWTIEYALQLLHTAP